MPKFVDWSPLFGYDIFISYKRGTGPGESSHYARALKQRLNAIDYQCFLDNDDAPAGGALSPTIERGIARSRTMVVLCTAAALRSEWVGKEVQAFSRFKRNTVIPVSFSRTLDSARAGEGGFASLTANERIWIEEDSADAPSDHVIGAIQARFVYMRANTRRTWFLGILAVVLAAAAGIALWQKHSADVNAAEAGRQKRSAETNAAEAFRQKAAADMNAAEARRQQQAAETNAAEAEKQRKTAEERRAEAVRQKEQALARYLSSQSTLLRGDSASDPQLITHLAAESVARLPVFENNQALRDAIDLLPRRTWRFEPVKDQTGERALSSDGSLLAVADRSGLVRVLRVDGGASVASFHASLAYVTLAMRPDGKQVVARDDTPGRPGIVIFDVEKQRESKRVVFGSAMWSAAYSRANEQIAVCMIGDELRVVNAAEGSERLVGKTFDGCRQFVFRSREATLAVLTSSSNVQEIMIATGARLPQKPWLSRSVMALSQDGERAAVGEASGTLGILTVESGARAGQVTSNYAIQKVALDLKGWRVAVSDSSKTLRVFDVASGQELAHTRAPFEVDYLNLSDDGSRVAISSKLRGDVVLEVAKDGVHIPMEPAFAISLSSNGARLARALDGDVSVVEVPSGKVTARFRVPNSVLGLALDTEGRRLTTIERISLGAGGAPTNGPVRRFDVERRQEVGHFRTAEAVLVQGVTADGTRVVSDTHPIQVADFDSERSVGKLSATPATVLALSGNGLRAAAADDSGRVRVFEVNGDGHEIVNVQVLRQPYTMQFSPDGSLIAVEDREGLIRVIEAGMGADVARIRSFAPVRGGVSFSADNRLLRVVEQLSGEMRIREYQLAGSDLLREACLRVPEPLSPALWSQYLAGEQYHPVCRAVSAKDGPGTRQ